jgi:hypothetical protein
MQGINSEPSTEEDIPMLRIRLASVALASGLLFLASGCNTCGEGRFFPRLFSSHSMSAPSMESECGCHSAHLPQMMDGAPGQMMTMPTAAGQTVPIPITNVPTSQPPQVFKVPMAAPTPYIPSH